MLSIPASPTDSVMIQENARLRDAIAVAQQQLHAAAAAAESRALAEAAHALQGEQQAHLLVLTISYFCLVCCFILRFFIPSTIHSFIHQHVCYLGHVLARYLYLPVMFDALRPAASG